MDNGAQAEVTQLDREAAWPGVKARWAAWCWFESNPLHDVKNKKKAPERIPTDPPIYDLRMTYTLTGTCRCCGVVDAETTPGTHQKGCPVPILEDLRYCLEIEVDRRGVTANATGSSLLQAAEGLYAQFEDAGVNWEPDTSGQADGETDIYTPIKAYVMAKAAVTGRQIHACMVQVDEQAQANHKAMLDAFAVMGLTAERRDRLGEVDKRREIYTDAGYEQVRNDILNDPKYANLPPIE